jgi:hypothetical protein
MSTETPSIMACLKTNVCFSPPDVSNPMYICLLNTYNTKLTRARIAPIPKRRPSASTAIPPINPPKRKKAAANKYGTGLRYPPRKAPTDVNAAVT